MNSVAFLMPCRIHSSAKHDLHLLCPLFPEQKRSIFPAMLSIMLISHKRFCLFYTYLLFWKSRSQISELWLPAEPVLRVIATVCTNQGGISAP